METPVQADRPSTQMEKAVEWSLDKSSVKTDVIKVTFLKFVAFMLESGAINAEKVVEELKNYVSVKGFRNDAEGVEGLKATWDKWRLQQSATYGAMQINCEEMDTFWKEVENRYGDKEKQKNKVHAEIVEKMVKDFHFYMQTNMAAFMEAHPVVVEGPVKGLRDRNAEWVQKFVYAEEGVEEVKYWGAEAKKVCKNGQEMLEAITEKNVVQRFDEEASL